jgi:hypothetical protein
VRRSLTALTQNAVSLHAVQEIPQSDVPRADHLLVWVTHEPLAWNPYRWERAGLLVHDGRIVAITPCALTPPVPPEYVVPPPTGGVAALDPSRRSGIAAVDAVLVALQARDLPALDDLFDYELKGCEVNPPDFGTTPLCLPGEPAGTPVEIVPEVVCHGGYQRRGNAAANVLIPGQQAPYALYAITAADPSSLPPGVPAPRALLSVVLASADGAAAALGFNERGITSITRLCAGPPIPPEALMPPGRVPDASYLLAPQ